MTAIYDRIGIGYSALRKPDSRISAAIRSALGPVETVLNVGAGTGYYEPLDCDVTTVEPSLEMIRQRDPLAAKAIRAHAEALPFDDDRFDASMATLTVHHWSGREKGLHEMRRVTRGPVVLLTFDPAHRGAWLTDYFPELITLNERQMPSMSDYEKWLGQVRILPLPDPHDCTDGFLYAYWRRPAAYLDAQVRSGRSSFWAMNNAQEGLGRLAQDLESGTWDCRYGEVRALAACDVGYQLVIAA